MQGVVDDCFLNFFVIALRMSCTTVYKSDCAVQICAETCPCSGLSQAAYLSQQAWSIHNKGFVCSGMERGLQLNGYYS